MAFDIILLSPNEDALALRQVLDAHSLGITFHHVIDLPGLREAIKRMQPKARLISYLSHVIVPRDCLEAFSLGAFNFHPGSPVYPGIAPEAWACYDRAKSFGATFHAMNTQLDAGEIIATEVLPVTAAKDRPGYANIARQALSLLLIRVASILTREAPIVAENRQEWGEKRHTVDDYNKMCVLEADISRDELLHRLKSFGPPGPVEFSLHLHGMRFVLEIPGGIMGHFDPPQPDRILGWVQDSNTQHVRQEVKLVVDGQDFILKADQYRPDVCAAGFGDGYSGFVWMVPPQLQDGRPHRIEAYCKGQPVPGSPRLAIFPKSDKGEENASEACRTKTNP